MCPAVRGFKYRRFQKVAMKLVERNHSGRVAPIAGSSTDFDTTRTNAGSHALNEKSNGAVEFLYTTDLQ